jgi:hypothetical protein
MQTTTSGLDKFSQDECGQDQEVFKSIQILNDVILLYCFVYITTHTLLRWWYNLDQYAT